MFAAFVDIFTMKLSVASGKTYLPIGIIIWQDENGIIYESSPNNKEKKIANSLYDYIVSKN